MTDRQTDRQNVAGSGTRALIDSDDSVLVLLDHAAGQLQTVKDISIAEPGANTTMLTRLAALLNIPSTTSASVPNRPNGPLMPEIHDSMLGMPRLWPLLLVPLLLLQPAAISADTQHADATRIVAIGDIHGDVEAFAGILKVAGLIDNERRWIGGRARLVVTGDYLDRGEYVRDVMDLLMGLESEAAAQGGLAEALLGNHEGMNLLHFLRDVSPAAFARFADDESEARRKSAYAAYVALVTERATEPAALASNVYKLKSKEEWMAEHPLGMLEYIAALGPDGQYGRWLRRRKPIVKLDDTILMHAGLDPSTAPKRLDDVGRTIAEELRAWDDGRRLLVRAGLILPFFTLQETVEAVRVEVKRIGSAVQDGSPRGDHVTPEFISRLQDIARVGWWSLLQEHGPLWFRGFATWRSPDDSPLVEALLKRYGAARFVGGHTVVGSFRILPRFGRRMFLIDTGMLSTHYNGRASALEIAGDRITAIYADGRELLDRRPSEPEFDESAPVPVAAVDGHAR